ncbi:SRPBCC family protein [Allonocardiopsis opalescens]|uniref:Polyketide cyclase/dehydrase/lipid transport protein n=1 Tax=Allonocardiopsis opalescens TaxID=1144618 RepID=A0A2T0Q7G0_9ACTN|nr:SRPBCC family protein [Allonocardiopsis opalescens]PRX99779.1 polyketide cyclase/dehydrase/lipid transport protein [Allonocardiopsis opalescens]
MAQVRAIAQRQIDAAPDVVYAALIDYEKTRPGLLPEQFTDYQVVAGGQGAGTEVRWRLHATEKRVRDVRAEVSEPAPNRLVEDDANSSMVTTWTVRPVGDGTCTVSIETVWQGAGGVGGFFERAFAPAGLRRIYDAVLARLDAHVRA